MSTYKIIFKNGVEKVFTIPANIDWTGDIVDIYDRNNKKIGFLNTKDISFIQRIFTGEKDEKNRFEKSHTTETNSNKR